jgi:DNA invertase Pin-like site-specific DNA recombinase
MTPKNRTAPLVPYLRQSRKTEQTISIEEQRRAITAWADASGVKLAREIVEQDVSGSKKWRERGLGQVLIACKNGTAQGVIVAFQDRLSREDLLGTAEVWTEFGEAGARIVACDGVDSAQDGQRLLYVVKAEIARQQWERTQTNWRNARSNAIERGVHVGQVPAGYARNVNPNDPKTIGWQPPEGELRDGVLVPSEHADAIREAFEIRARGGSWTDVASHLSEAGVPTSRKKKDTKGERTIVNTKWSLKAAEKLLRNPAYLGQVRSGEYLQEGAHPALVTRSTFFKVAARKETKKRSKGNGGALLAGLLRCSSCGHALTRNFTVRNDKRYEFYTCKNQGACDARPSIGLEPVERYVVNEVLSRLNVSVELPDNTAKRTKLERAVELAEDEVAAFMEATSASVIGPELFGQGLATRSRKVEDAKTALEELPIIEGDGIAKEYVSIAKELESADGDLYDAFLLLDKTVGFKRNLLSLSLDHGVVTRGRDTVENRVTLVFHEDDDRAMTVDPVDSDDIGFTIINPPDALKRILERRERESA